MRVGVGGDAAARLVGGHHHAEEAPAAAVRARDRGAARGRGAVGAEERAREEARRGVERGGDERGVDVEGHAAEAEPLLAVAPVAGHPALLERDEQARARRGGEGARRGGGRARGSARARRRRSPPKACAARGTRSRARARARVEEVRGRDRREEEVVVDHRVVEHGRSRSARPSARSSRAPPRRSPPRARRRRPATSRSITAPSPASTTLGRSTGRSRLHGQQRVAAEVREEAPRAGEELLLVGQEGEALERAVVARRAVDEELARRDGRERRVVGERREGDAERLARRGREGDVPVGVGAHGGAAQGREAERDVAAAERGAREA